MKRSISLCAVAIWGFLLINGCTPSATGPAAGTGGRREGTGGAPGSGGSAPGTGGSAPGTGGSAPATGGSGSGGAPATGGSGVGNSGSGGAALGSGGRMGSGGDGADASVDAARDAAPPGSGGSSGATGGVGSGGTGAGTGGAGGMARDGGADASAGGRSGSTGGGAGTSPAEALDKFRMECPCKPGAADHTSDGNCNVTPATDRQTIVKTMGGDAATIYDVTLRVRGLTEPNTYRSGTLQGQRFYIGGSTSTAGYTSYMMTVADPAQHYFFNYNATTGHIHFILDYQVTVKIRGGSKVTFDVDGDGSVPDGHQVSNSDQTVVPDVPPAPMWYDGQFVQLDVVSAVESK